MITANTYLVLTRFGSKLFTLLSLLNSRNNSIMVVNPVCELIVQLTVSSVFYSNSTLF